MSKDIKIFVILYPNKTTSNGMKEEHYAKYPDNPNANKISKDKWFSLMDNGAKVLQPLYDES